MEEQLGYGLVLLPLTIVIYYIIVWRMGGKEREGGYPPF